MNYLKIHDQLIELAKNQNRKKLKQNHPDYQYYESHHIIPRCLGGTDDKENLVLLTAREHFLIHKLLVKIYPGNQKLYSAFFRCCQINNKDRQFSINSRDYEEARKLHATAISKLHKNRQLPDSQKQHLSILNMGKKRTIESIEKQIITQTGKTRSLETKLKCSEAAKNRKQVICPICQKIGNISNMKRYHFNNCKLNKT